MSEKQAINVSFILSKIRPYRIIRDVILLQMLAYVGGFLVGFTASRLGEETVPPFPVAVASIILVPIALSIIGTINSSNRWFHITVVMIASSSFDKIYYVLEGNDFRLPSVGEILWYLAFIVMGGLLSMVYPIFRNREPINLVPEPENDISVKEPQKGT